MKEIPGKEILIERAIQAYIVDFDRNNHRDGTSLRNETRKWTAAANFARNWDINAEDMLSMWKRCSKNAFIDTRRNHPTEGIRRLLKHPSEVDGVRNAFSALFDIDVVDVEEKWNRIQEFIEYVNGRLTELYPNSSSNLQTKEDVITYLNLWDPDHNYRYKPSPANNWASYIGYADWETGQRFSLRKYYKMCEEIREVVKNHQDLLRIHRQRFENGEPDYDKELHILTFDVLYCFWGYEDARREALEEYQEAMRQQRIDNLEEKLNKMREEIQIKTDAVAYPDCEGVIVHHKKFGTGTVDKLEDKRMTVEFETEGTKKFIFPDAFVRGFLQPKNDSLMEKVKQSNQIEKELIALRDLEKQLEGELASIEENS